MHRKEMMFNKSLLIIFSLLILSEAHLSQTTDKYYLFNSHPISSLPLSVPILENKVYLWADTTKLEDNKLQVLIINNSKKTLNFNGYQFARIQPEYKSDDRGWLRFVSLNYGWCGTSYADNIIIPPSEYYVSLEYFRPGNVESEIRFAFLGDTILCTNSFIARIDTSEVEIAKYDDITYSICDLDYLINVIEEMPKPYKDIPASQSSLHIHNRDSFFIKGFNDDVVFRAMNYLVKRFPEKAVEFFETLSKDENYPYRETADRILNAIINK